MCTIIYEISSKSASHPTSHDDSVRIDDIGPDAFVIEFRPSIRSRIRPSCARFRDTDPTLFDTHAVHPRTETILPFERTEGVSGLTDGVLG